MAGIIKPALSEQIDIRPLLAGSVATHTIAEAESRSLQQLFGLGRTSACNIVLIAIDFENISNIQRDLSQNLDSEVGLAILDARDLDSISSTKLIATYNFTSGSLNYQERARKKFLFGETVALTQNDMLKSIRFLVPTDRQVIFVGHDIQNDLRALDLLNFDFSTFNITTLDTQSISRKLISYNSSTLRRLLLTLGCPFIKLHCGGNDANFTLKALLLLVAKTYNGQTGVERRLAIIKEIALSPLPQIGNPIITTFSYTDSQTRAAKKRAKRLQRSRNHQSKLWDT